jgi:hypothetical protein
MRKASAVVVPQFSAMLFATSNKLSRLINKVINFIKSFKSAVRPNRSFVRKPNASRHSVNYKSNFLCFLS